MDSRPAFLQFAQDNNLFHDSAHQSVYHADVDTGNNILLDKSVYVLPAYEMNADIQVGNVPRNKTALMQLVRRNELRPFYVELCWKCQKHTQYELWEKEPETSRLSVLFEVLWKDPWEPFYISRNDVPFYDERFKQYGFNRISQVSRPFLMIPFN